VSLSCHGREQRSCETRLAREEEGYELVIGQSGSTRVERFSPYRALLVREHQVLTRWTAQRNLSPWCMTIGE
jgi:hypothetical protein